MGLLDPRLGVEGLALRTPEPRDEARHIIGAAGQIELLAETRNGR